MGRRKMNDYLESADGETITKARALRELARHGLSGQVADFLRDLGDRETYSATAVLHWIGY